MQSTTKAADSIQGLLEKGFTRSEIDRLLALRDRYDAFRECCESNQEYERLAFLKWRYQRGEFSVELT